MLLQLYENDLPDAVARSETRPPSMRTVAGSILTSGNIPSWRLVMKKCLRPHSFPLIQEAQLSVTDERCALSTGKLPKRLAQEQRG